VNFLSLDDDCGVLIDADADDARVLTHCAEQAADSSALREMLIDNYSANET
jgi:hypothetical protein